MANYKERLELQSGSSVVRGLVLGLCGFALCLPPLIGCRRGPLTVAVVPRTCGTWLWEAEHTGAAREALRHSISVYWNAPMREDDVQRQIDILASAVKRHMTGVIIAPIEDLPLRTPLQRTVHAGVPVVVVDSDLGLPPGKTLTYVLNNETLGGQMAARRLGKILHGKGTVAIVGINNKLASMEERARSLERTLAEEFPAVHVVFRSLALPTVAQEQQVAERMLASGIHPDAVVTLSEPATRGMYFALIEFNENGKIPLLGFDQNLLAPVRTGEIDSVVIQNTFEIGRVAMLAMSRELDHEPVEARYTVEPRLVTRETIDSAEVRQTLDLDWYRP